MSRVNGWLTSTTFPVLLEESGDAGLSALTIAGIVISVVFCLLVVVYILNQRHLFNRQTTACLSRFYFYPALTLTWLDHLTRSWWTEVDDGVFIGAVPLVCLGHVNKLYQQGVRAVINLQDEYAGPVAAYRTKGIQQLYLPVVDHHEPSLEQLKEAVQYIQDQREIGHGVYIHCKGGHGRSAAVAFCFILLAKGWDLQTTQRYLLTRRKVRKKLYAQLNIIGYYSDLQKSKGSAGSMGKI